MGCVNGKSSSLSMSGTVSRFNSTESDIERTAHIRRKTQHMIQNLVHEEYKLRVDEVYDLTGGKILGTGISGMVRVVRHLQTGQLYAMKTLHLNRLKSKASLDDLRNEVQIMSELDHPNIVQLFETFETEEHIFLIMELCTGGELLDKLHRQEGHHYSEQTAAQLIKTMVGAIRYCHEHHITHRDLKLENFLFDHDAQDAQLKLIDFGLSRHYRENVCMHRPVGTPYYVAPEVLQGAYTQECDMWSIGVITYMLVSGRPPFYGKDDGETLARVRTGQYTFPSPVFDNISPAAKDFIQRLLVVDYQKRMTAKDAQEHPWLHICDPPVPNPLSLDLIGSLRNFHKFCTIKKIALEVVAFTLRPEQIRELRKEFEKVDINSNGEISIEALNQALRSSGLLSPQDLEHLVKSLDGIHCSGTISWREFLAATMDASALDDELIQLAFNRIDNDRTGFISKENLAELVGVDMSAEQVEKVFAEIDVDKDGRINFHTFAALMKGTDLPRTTSASTDTRDPGALPLSTNGPSTGQAAASSSSSASATNTSGKRTTRLSQLLRSLSHPSPRHSHSKSGGHANDTNTRL